MGVLTRSMVLGLAAGGRSSTSFAVPVLAAVRGREGGGPQLASALARSAVLGEVVVDKLPSTPSRLDEPMLAARVGAGALGALALSVVAAGVSFAIVELARRSDHLVGRKPWLLIPGVGLVVAVLAIVFAQITGQSADVVLFSGEGAFDSMFAQAATLSLGTLFLLLVLKSAAWSLSMGSFRGGPTFPALFVGAVGGLLAAHLPGFSETPAVAALMGATAVAILRLPLSSVVIAMLLTSRAGLATAPIIIVAVVASYITIETLSAKRPRSQVTAAP